MKNSIYILLILAFMSCNKEEDATEQTLEVEVTGIVPVKLFYGDILTVFANKFNPNITNTVTINDVEQEITYLTNEEIKIKIVDGTTSGDAILSNSEGTVVLGSLKVASETVYRRIEDDVIKIDLKSGDGTEMTFDTQCNIYRDGIYKVAQNPITKEFVCSSIYVIDGSGSADAYFDTYNADTGNCTIVPGSGLYNDLIFSNNGRLFDSQYDDIVELNPATGEKLGTFLSIQRTETLIFDKSTNSMLFTVDTGNGFMLHQYFMDTNQHSTVNIPVAPTQIYTLPDGRLLISGKTSYNNCHSVFEIDRQTGEIIDVLYEVAPPACSTDGKRLRYLNYLPSVNMLLIDFTQRHIVLDMDTKEATIYQMSQGKDYYEFINPIK
tara:strand:- start:3006 stop:4145 length:1140 start_codon:yes stop_codon:yes gene_type:complete